MESVGDELNRLELLRATVAVGACLPFAREIPINERKTGNFLPVHAPCIVKAGDTYHWFRTRHAGDPNRPNRSVLRIAPVDWTPDGWPRVTA